MKRQFALLFALTFLVSGMASMAEEVATDVEASATVETEIVETAEAPMGERTVPFEDGDWMSIPEWNAEVYLPTGWLLSEVTETGFIASDAEETSTLTVTLEDFLMEEPSEAEAVAEAEATAETEEVADESDAVELSAFEEYLMGLGQEYELTLMGDRQAAVLTDEDSVAVKFLLHNQLVTMDFAPATEGGIADSALSIAETFYVYDEVRPVEGEIPEEAAEEAVAE